MENQMAVIRRTILWRHLPITCGFIGVKRSVNSNINTLIQMLSPIVMQQDFP